MCPPSKLKRQLWSRLLRSALGTQFTDTDELFVEHTLLVNSAEIIAHLVLGLDVTDMQPATLLGGQRFDLAQIYGVVDEDFLRLGTRSARRCVLRPDHGPPARPVRLDERRA